MHRNMKKTLTMLSLWLVALLLCLVAVTAMIGTVVLAFDITEATSGTYPSADVYPSVYTGPTGDTGSTEPTIPEPLSGTCGEALTWDLSSDGVLTISGTGAMTDYESYSAPWYGLDYVTDLVIEEGVTHIGDYAFISLRLDRDTYLDLTLPNTLISIGQHAFDCVDHIGTICFGDRLRSVGGCAFSESSSITRVIFNGDAPSIGGGCFGSVNCSVFYPADNATWTEEVMQQYGGNLVWIAGEPTAEPVAIASGYCGYDETFPAWTLYDNGHLAITGSGAMEDVGYFSCPWYWYRPSVRTASIGEGVTRVGSYVFYSSDRLEGVTLSSTVEVIGEYAFGLCYELRAIEIPQGVKEIEYCAFNNCSSLTRITFLGDPPFIDSDAFFNVSAIGVSPSDNPNWTIAYYQSYGGGLCWSTSAKQPELTLSYPSLSFEDEIIYNVYFNASNTENVVEMGLMTFASRLEYGTVAEAMDILPNAQSTGDLYMAQTAGIAACNMGDTLYFKAYAKLSDGTYVYSDVAGYNSVAYANTVFKNSDSNEMKALVVAMLNYGAQAQTFFGHNVDTLMNVGLTAEQQALVGAYDEAMVDAPVAADTAKVGEFVLNREGFTDLRPTVSFESAFSINYYFTTAFAPEDGMTMYYWTAADYAAADVLTADNATGAMVMKATETTNKLWGEVAGIAAAELDQTVYVTAVYAANGTTYSTGVIAYHVGRYCETLAANNRSTMQAFAASTATYGYYAKNYFAS